ncbi:MAG: hypothetical protein VXW91_01305, partial [Pseudomonadota bacterium]|nr:hypothetical protein [Pseudomonadota bacterium]
MTQDSSDHSNGQPEEEDMLVLELEDVEVTTSELPSQAPAGAGATLVEGEIVDDINDKARDLVTKEHI